MKLNQSLFTCDKKLCLLATLNWKLLLHNLVPRAFSLVKMGDRRNPWPRLLKYSKNCGVFCQVTHYEKAFSGFFSSVWRSCLFSCNLKPFFKPSQDLSSCLRVKTSRMFGAINFGSLGQGFLRSAILNEEKALGTTFASPQIPVMTIKLT